MKQNNRPKIICHMITSVDGRLQMSRWTAPAEEEHLQAMLDAYENIADGFDADGWMCGRVTMEDFAHGTPLHVEAAGILRENYVAPHDERRIVVSIDPHGKLHYGRNSIHGNHLVAVLGTQVSYEYLAELRAEGVSYIFAGEDGHDIPQALSTLYELFGVRILLLEGGAVINGAFLKAGVIDELSLLVYPGLDANASAPSIFEYRGDAEDCPAWGQSLRLNHAERLDGGMLWLRYGIEESTLSSMKVWKEKLPISCDSE